MFKIKKKDIITSIVFIRQFLKAKRLIRNIKPIQAESGLVIIPCDPETVVGSRGDEAMIHSVIDNFRKRHIDEPIYIVAQGTVAANYVLNAELDKNIKVIECWNGGYPFEKIYNEVVGLKPRESVIIGADCIDGAYAPNLSLDLLCFQSAFKKSEINSYITGFSYNDHPYGLINYAVRHLNLSGIPLRDNISLSRFERKTNVKGSLVADVAFLLSEDTCFDEYEHLKKWVKDRHENEKEVIAFNFHPMLRTYHTASDLDKDAKQMADNLLHFMERNEKVSLLLLPHDDRNRINDATMLDKIFNILQNHLSEERLRYLKRVPRAAHIKAITALMDGVISSRMHLAIASLGSGIPVMVADYQGKFEGLFNHFNIPQKFRLTSDEFCSETFIIRMEEFMNNKNELKQTIIDNLPQVKSLAAKNFDSCL